MSLININFDKNIIKKHLFTIDFFTLIAKSIFNTNTIRTDPIKARPTTNQEVFFCRPELILKHFKKLLKRFNNNSITTDEFFSTFMFIQPNAINNLLILKYFFCVYNVITNGTFTMWNYYISNADYNSVFNFNARINDLATYYTDDIFFSPKPYWTDILIFTNLSCNSFILMCRCLNFYEINNNPIYINDPNDYVEVISDDDTNDISDTDSIITNYSSSYSNDRNENESNTNNSVTNTYRNEFILSNDLEYNNYYNFYTNKLLIL